MTGSRPVLNNRLLLRRLAHPQLAADTSIAFVCCKPPGWVLPVTGGPQPLAFQLNSGIQRGT